jgi:hypothetical protein
VVACVFDTSDRVQHMFYRHFEGRGDPQWQGAIADLYERMDVLAGKAMASIWTTTPCCSSSPITASAVPPGRESQLLAAPERLPLALTGNRTESGSLLPPRRLDRTRAYCLGLSGLYLNVRGREAQGIVARREAEALKVS